MKICFICQHFSIPAGSSGVRMYNMARRLIENGHDVTIICGSYKGGVTGINKKFENGQRKGVYNGINIVEYNIPYSNKQGFYRRIYSFFIYLCRSSLLITSIDHDLVIASSTPLTTGIPGMISKIFRNKKFVFEVRDLWPELPKSLKIIKNPIFLFLLSYLEKKIYKTADKIIALSPGIVKGIEKKNINLDKIKLIPNGCDLTLFSNKSTSQNITNTKKEDLKLIFSGTHGFANGLDIIIDVAEELKKRNITGIKFILVGQGKEKSKLIYSAKSKNLDSIVFLNPLDKKNLSRMFSSVDIGMQILKNIPAFYYGTSPNKFFDYLSSGLPVITNYPGWIADLIIEHDCGFVVNPDDPKDFCKVILEIQKNKKLLYDKGINSFNLAKSRFDMKNLSQKWVEWATTGFN